ncbi:MAG: pilus (MSHA type) biogenesis protein MshL [Burkholderiales bacterium]|nr:pilus (MSHA type) biogenesis protein MshL [Burkholderiales bacterium]
MKRIIAILLLVLCAGCNNFQPRQGKTLDRIDKELEAGAADRKAVKEADAVSQALLPPVVVEMPKLDGKPIEPRFDLSVVNAPAAQVFTAIVSGTRYSMVVHPQIKEPISVTLKDVTVIEALDTIRELYGYDYKQAGSRILVQPASIQTRVFQVNYLMSQRRGRSDVRVSSGAISDTVAPTAGLPGVGGVPAPMVPTAAGALPGQAATASQAIVGSRVVTTNDSDMWKELTDALKAIVGTENGRQVVLSPQSGVILVRGMPAEIRAVEDYLRATRIVIERQVMLEAKIIEVELSDGYQAGVNWAAFRTGDNSRLAGGVIVPGSNLTPSGTLSTPTARAPDGSILASSLLTANPGAPGNISTGVGVPGTLFGLAFQTGNFATLLSFLQTQGNLQVLSSPRIAALNNQKAVLKVGNDEFFVTNVTTTTLTNVAGGTTQSPSITVQPFFSGVALDVTPQVDENNQIILHVHPSVSEVVEKTKNIDLGTSGNFRLPLASSTISETDTIVRVQDGNIVAIGGLMRETTQRNRSGVPGLSNLPGVGNLFRSSANSARKSELVILIKPTIVQGDAGSQKDLEDIRNRIKSFDRADRPGADSMWGDGASK